MSVRRRFIISQIVALLWCGLSVYLSLNWLRDLSEITGFILALVIIICISYIPSYFVMFLIMSIVTNKHDVLKELEKYPDVTLLVAARNEEENIKGTLNTIADQKYAGKLKVIVIDNSSEDKTVEIVKEYMKDSDMDIRVLHCEQLGKNFALNYGLEHVDTELIITLDADTELQENSIKYIVERMYLSEEYKVAAVAGSVFAKNAKKNFLTLVQTWDYFVGIASVKRQQGSFESTLVAQGAFSLYKTKIVREVKGWPDAIGEDIVLTWRMLHAGYKVLFEPKAVGFTSVPEKFSHFAKQRSRWARGMFEGLKEIKPWQHKNLVTKYLTSTNLIIPMLDVVFTFCWIPGLIIAFFGYYWVVGPMTLFVIPLAIAVCTVFFGYQRKIFKSLGLKSQKNVIGLIFYICIYQLMMAPIAVYGYVQELFSFKRVWK